MGGEQEMAEASLKSFGDVINKTGVTEVIKPVETSVEFEEEALSELVDESVKALEEEKITSAPAISKLKKGSKEPKGKIEARLEFLAKMYEAKKDEQIERKTVQEDK